jgi:hypothetical protein
VAFARIDARAAVRASRDELFHLGDRIPVAYDIKPVLNVA